MTSQYFRLLLLAAFAVSSVAARPAAASFHLMQIEQALGATCGNVEQQAVQLRMRSGGQSVVSQASLWVRDSAGQNPILLLDIPSDVTTGTAGSRILLATQAFADAHGFAPDFVLAAPIPVSYLEAGRLTFESDGGIIYWSLAWGGAAYTGANLGSVNNDMDGDFGPAFANALGSSHSQAILFPGAAGAFSTTNAADYVLTGNMPTFTDNGGSAVTLANCVFGDGFESGTTSSWDQAIP